MLAFAASELPPALEVILERRPRVVIVNEAIATTSPAIALIERIRYDAALQPCEPGGSFRDRPFGGGRRGPFEEERLWGDAEAEHLLLAGVVDDSSEPLD